MKTKSFRLLTVLLAAVMMVALSLNVMAAKSNAVTKDGLNLIVGNADNDEHPKCYDRRNKCQNKGKLNVYTVGRMTVEGSFIYNSRGGEVDMRLYLLCAHCAERVNYLL